MATDREYADREDASSEATTMTESRQKIETRQRETVERKEAEWIARPDRPYECGDRKKAAYGDER